MVRGEFEYRMVYLIKQENYSKQFKTNVNSNFLYVKICARYVNFFFVFSSKCFPFFLFNFFSFYLFQLPFISPLPLSFYFYFFHVFFYIFCSYISFLTLIKGKNYKINSSLIEKMIADSPNCQSSL